MAYFRNASKHAFTIFIAAELLLKRKYPKLPLNPRSNFWRIIHYKIPKARKIF